MDSRFMKTARQWAIEHFNLAEDEKQNTARWRAMQQPLDDMVKFIEEIQKDVDNFYCLNC